MANIYHYHHLQILKNTTVEIYQWEGFNTTQARRPAESKKLSGLSGEKQSGKWSTAEDIFISIYLFTRKLILQKFITFKQEE